MNNLGSQLITDAIGKEIILLAFNGADLRVKVEDGATFKLWDRSQLCCEARWMTCDDDLPSFIGDTLLGVEIADAPNDTYHDVQFLRILTSGGVIVASTHNEHNGNYGGFNVQVARA